MTIEHKQQQLELLYEEYAACTRCPLATPTGRTRRNVVFGHGNPDARLVIVGEGPGEAEDATGEPFQGPSGEILDQFLSSFRSSRDEVFITNIVMCRPTEMGDPQANRKPEKDEIAGCQERLHRTIAIIDPWAILLLGDTAVKALCPEKVSLTSYVNSPRYMSVPVITKELGTSVTRRGFPSFHPAYLARNWDMSPNGAVHMAYRTWERAFSYVDRCANLYLGTPMPVRST